MFHILNLGRLWAAALRRHGSAKKAQLPRFKPSLDGLEDRLCPSSTTVLPISAFLAQQGHDSFFSDTVPAANGGVRDQNAWTNSTFDPGTTPSDPHRSLLADFTGQEAQYLMAHGINLHTTVTGFVTETNIASTNLMEVSVNLEARNALTLVTNIENLPNGGNVADAVELATPELGYTAQELAANHALQPALSSVHFQVTWVEQQGADLPDLARLNENYTLYAPPGFNFEVFDVQVWGTGTIRNGSSVGTPGNTAIVSTSQIGDLRYPNLPGTLGDGFWHEPVDIIPVPSASTHVAYLNGTVFVLNQADANNHVTVSPAGLGVSVASNLGNASYTPVTRVAVMLSGGNNQVQIGNLAGVTTDVVAFDGNNNINVGNVGKLAVHVGGGNNKISTANTSGGAQFICVGGSGNNNISTNHASTADILVAGNGNNNINADGLGDSIEVLGNGNNHISDTGSNDLVILGGDGNNNVDNAGTGSSTEILAGTGHNHIRGSFVIGSAV